jgi:hypothetical protein
VKAGLFPLLRKAGWKIAYVRILHDNISEVIQGIWFQIMESEPPSSEVSFIDTLQHISKQNQHFVLILFDQFNDALKFNNVFTQIKEALYHIQATRFHNLRILLCYRSDFEGQVGPILQDIAYSLRAIPRFYLCALNRSGAEDALVAGMNSAQVGFDPDIGVKGFIKLILDDIERQGRGFYPPYIQMIGETLRDSVLDNQSGIVRKATYDSLHGAAGIIGNYLFKQLESFA